MEQAVISLLVSFLLLGAASAFPSFNPGVRIINGNSAEPGQFPFIVALKDSGGQFCDGSIISKNWVITAAHCTGRLLVESVQILAGTNILHTGGTIYNVTKAINHPDFSRISLQNDIALLKIDEDIQFNDLVQPINVGYAESNDTVTVAGWGTAEDTDVPEDLRYVDLRALSLEECEERAKNYMDYYYLGHEQVCALANDSNKGPCFGDSGGPLISNGKLVGIVSYAFLSCAEGIPDVYTRPSAYTEWINQNIQE